MAESAIKAELQPFFEPRSVAIIGVSKTPGRPGYVFLDNLLRLGFKGSVYPCNPKWSEIRGVKVYPSVEDIPDSIDLAVLLNPASEIPDVVERCTTKGAKGIVIVSGGFAEAHKDGAEIEKQVVEIARRGGARVMGPNVVGPINSANNLALSLTPIRTIKKGPVAFISQTGMFVSLLVEMLTSSLNLGVSKMVDLGNKSDVDDSDVIRYFAEDAETKVIAVHIEGVKNGQQLLDTAKRVSRQKPIVVFKTGVSEAGAMAAASHTGSIAGDDLISEAAFRQAGIIRVGDLDEFLGVAKAFAFLPPSKGNRVGVLNFSGGLGTMTIDICEESGLRAAKFSESTVGRLKQLYPPGYTVSNPLDFGPSFPVHGFQRMYEAGLDAVMSDEEVDCVIAALPIWSVEQPGGVNDIGFIEPLVKAHGKPMVVHLAGYRGRFKSPAKFLEEQGIPVFESIRIAVKSLAALCRYSVNSLSGGGNGIRTHDPDLSE